MKKQLTKKLTLKKENIAYLNDDEMEKTQGGITLTSTLSIVCTIGCTISCSVIAPCCIKEE